MSHKYAEMLRANNDHLYKLSYESDKSVPPPFPVVEYMGKVEDSMVRFVHNHHILVQTMESFLHNGTISFEQKVSSEELLLGEQFVTCSATVIKTYMDTIHGNGSPNPSLGREPKDYLAVPGPFITYRLVTELFKGTLEKDFNDTITRMESMGMGKVEKVELDRIRGRNITHTLVFWKKHPQEFPLDVLEKVNLDLLAYQKSYQQAYPSSKRFDLLRGQLDELKVKTITGETA